MRGRHFGLGLLASIAAATLPSAATGQTADEGEIQNLQTQQAETWNRHDAADYARLFTEDGDVVNVVGWWWKGRPEIEGKLTAAFAFVFRDSRMAITDTHVRFLTSDIAVAHVRWTMTGAKMPPGMPEPREGIQLQVLKRISGKWLIANFQNTNSVPERPFPTGPVGPSSAPSARPSAAPST